MSAVPKSHLSAAEYLEIERKATFKSEFYRGEMFAMAGAKYPHVRVNDNLLFEIMKRLQGGNCEVLSRDLRVHVVRTGLYTYPDLTIVCGEPEFEDDEDDILLNPRVIFEVLSPSSEQYDRGQKYAMYQMIPSLQEYVLVSQNEAKLERFTRQNDGEWTTETVLGLKAEFKLTSVSMKPIPLKDIYHGIHFKTNSAS